MEFITLSDRERPPDFSIASLLQNDINEGLRITGLIHKQSEKDKLPKYN
jgi:hypothetical protein